MTAGWLVDSIDTSDDRRLRVRFEPFEYGLLPLPDLIFPDPLAVLGSLRRKMHRYSRNVGKKGRINIAGISLCLGIMYDQAQLLLETLAAVSPNTDAISHVPSAEIDSVGGSIDELIMFLYLQNYKRAHIRHHMDVAAVEDVWPEDGSFPHFPVPHSKTRRTAAPSHADEEIHQTCYIKKHLPDLLSLLADPLENNSLDSQVLISGEQFNHLGFFIQSKEIHLMAMSLSRISPFFTHSGPSTHSPLVPVEIVSDWVIKHLCADSDHLQRMGEHGLVFRDESIAPANSHNSGFSVDEDFNIIDGVIKVSILKDESDINGGSVKVTNCHESAIYVLAPLKYATVYGCSDSVVVLGAVGKAVRMEHCERVQLIVASVRICITSCRECVFYLAVNQVPIILGENHSLQVAPYNTFYPRLEAHLRQVGFDLSVNKWDEQITFGALDPHDSITHAAGLADAQSEGASLLPPEHFTSCVVPKWNESDSIPRTSLTTRNPFLLPKPYFQSQQQRSKAAQKLKEALEFLELSEERKQDLAHVIHVHFKEWLSVSGNVCQLYAFQQEQDEV